MPRTVARTCHLCEAMCGLLLEVDGDQVTSVVGDPDDPLSGGYLCPKGAAIADIHHDPDRLRQPLVRNADGVLEPTDWATALDAAAAGLRGVRERHGANAVAAYVGNPTAHTHAVLVLPILLKSLETHNVSSASTVDQRPHEMASWMLYGHSQLLPVPDLDRAEHLLILGANPAVSNGSLMTAPDAKRRIKAIRSRGGSVTVVDPRRTETARIADEHVFIQPGTDVFLLAAMVATIFEEGLDNPGDLSDFTDGLNEVAAWCKPFMPEAVEARTGIDAQTTRRLARAFAAAPRAVAYGRLGICLQETGTVAAWLVNVLNIVTGNLDHPGGPMFPTPAFDVVGATGGGRHDRFRSRVNDRPEFSGELPASELTAEMTTPGEGQVRGFLVHAGNPVLSTPDGERLDAALANLEFMVAIDIYVTETTRHADVILPSTSPLERSHYDTAFNNLAIRNTAKWSAPVFDPPPDAMVDWEIILELAQRLLGDQDRAATMARRYGDAKDVDEIIAAGIAFGPWGTAAKGDEGISFEDLREQPHGIDLGPLESRLPERLRTEDQRIHLDHPLIAAEMERIAELINEPVAAREGFALIGRRQLRSHNSWLHNLDRLVKGRDRCTCMMHPADASQHGLKDGQQVTVSSTVGAIDVPLEITDEIMQGVVSIPHGWGHNRAGVGWSTAKAKGGANVNALTDATLLDRISGNAALSEVRVKVAAS